MKKRHLFILMFLKEIVNWLLPLIEEQSIYLFNLYKIIIIIQT